jgi:hypothetical protein
VRVQVKSCPQCLRTYSDMTLSFCPEDGALLSRPIAVEELGEATVVSPPANRTAPPPTERYHKAEPSIDPPPTIAATPPALAAAPRAEQRLSNVRESDMTEPRSMAGPVAFSFAAGILAILSSILGLQGLIILGSPQASGERVLVPLLLSLLSAGCAWLCVRAAQYFNRPKKKPSG